MADASPLWILLFYRLKVFSSQHQGTVAQGSCILAVFFSPPFLKKCKSPFQGSALCDVTVGQQQPPEGIDATPPPALLVCLDVHLVSGQTHRFTPGEPANRGLNMLIMVV